MRVREICTSRVITESSTLLKFGENLRVFQVLCRLLSIYPFHDAYHILSHGAHWIWRTFQAQTEQGSAVGVALRPLHPSESQPSPIRNVLVVDQGPRTENYLIYQVGYVLGGARWRLPTGSLLLQVDLERGRAVCWVTLLFKCKLISWSTRHQFYYLKIYLVYDIYLDFCIHLWYLSAKIYFLRWISVYNKPEKIQTSIIKHNRIFNSMPSKVLLKMQSALSKSSI